MSKGKEKLRSCPHCCKRMQLWRTPDESSWGGVVWYVCFNNSCPYFVAGWDRMRERYDVQASYRHRVDPSTGHSGPLPVWSKEALRTAIVDEEEMDDS